MKRRDIRVWIAAAVVLLPVGASASEVRLSSPAKKFDIIFTAVPANQASVSETVKGAHRRARDQYRLDFWPAGSTTTVNSMVYQDAESPASPNDILAAMVWGPNETHVAVPVMIKAREGKHVFQDVVALNSSGHVLQMEADHPHWVDEDRLVGDLDTPQMPGGIILLNAKKRKVEVILAPMAGLGYKIVSVDGPAVTVQEITNELTQDKTTWESFTPACLILNVDTLKKRSVPCP